MKFLAALLLGSACAHAHFVHYFSYLTFTTFEGFGGDWDENELLVYTDNDDSCRTVGSSTDYGSGSNFGITVDGTYRFPARDGHADFTLHFYDNPSKEGRFSVGDNVGWVKYETGEWYWLTYYYGSCCHETTFGQQSDVRYMLKVEGD